MTIAISGPGHESFSLEELEAAIAPVISRFEFNERPKGTSLDDDQATRLRRLLEAEPPFSRVVSAPASIRERSALTAHMAGDESAATRTERGAKTVVVASGKGGVGKTTLSVNLAIALAARGTRVTLLDADFGTANADVMCGLSPSGRLDHVFAPGGEQWGDGSPRSIRDIAIDAPGGFRLIPGTTGIARMADLSPGERAALVDALSELDADTDVVIIDTAAGVGKSVTAFMAAADLSLIVATPEPTSIADAYALIKCAVTAQGDHSQTPNVALILNQVVDSSEASRVHGRISAVCDRFLAVQCPMLGSVAQDMRVPESIRARTPVTLRSPAAASAVQIRYLADRLSQQLGVACEKHGMSRASGGVRGMVRRLLSFSRSAG